MILLSTTFNFEETSTENIKHSVRHLCFMGMRKNMRLPEHFYARLWAASSVKKPYSTHTVHVICGIRTDNYPGGNTVLSQTLNS